MFTGSRSITSCRNLVWQILSKYNPKEWVVIVGDARGVDSIVADVAKKRGFVVLVAYANWNTWGRGSGIVRNNIMVDIATEGYGIWDGTSKGTLQACNAPCGARQAKRMLQGECRMSCGTTHYPNSKIVLCHDCGGGGHKLYDADDWGAQTYRGKCWVCDGVGLLWVSDVRHTYSNYPRGPVTRCLLHEWQVDDEKVKERLEKLPPNTNVLAFPNLRKKPRWVD